MYFEKGRYDVAIRDYTKAVELAPERALPHVNRGAAYFKKGDYDKAWADVKECQHLGGKVDPAFLAELRKASGREE